MNETISTLHKTVEESEPNICEITVIRDGEVCYEDYWHGFQPGDALNVMSATDMAWLGQMCLEGGVFQGRQIVSGKWIQEMTTAYQDLGERFGYMSYGYLWWVTDKEKHNYAAIGDGGNVIYVNPEKKIVVGVAGTFKPRIFDRVDFIEKKLLPLLMKR